MKLLPFALATLSPTLAIPPIAINAISSQENGVPEDAKTDITLSTSLSFSNQTLGVEEGVQDFTHGAPTKAGSAYQTLNSVDLSFSISITKTQLDKMLYQQAVIPLSDFEYKISKQSGNIENSRSSTSYDTTSNESADGVGIPGGINSNSNPTQDQLHTIIDANGSRYCDAGVYNNIHNKMTQELYQNYNNTYSRFGGQESSSGGEAKANLGFAIFCNASLLTLSAKEISPKPKQVEFTLSQPDTNIGSFYNFFSPAQGYGGMCGRTNGVARYSQQETIICKGSEGYHPPMAGSCHVEFPKFSCPAIFDSRIKIDQIVTFDNPLDE